MARTDKLCVYDTMPCSALIVQSNNINYGIHSKGSFIRDILPDVQPEICVTDCHVLLSFSPLPMQSAVKEIEGVATNGSNYLYTTESNYMDFNVDDNGLWVIYSTPDSNNTIVAKVMQ